MKLMTNNNYNIMEWSSNYTFQIFQNESRYDGTNWAVNNPCPLDILDTAMLGRSIVSKPEDPAVNKLISVENHRVETG